MVQLLLFIKFVTSNPIFVLRPILKTNNSFKDQKLFYDLKTTMQSDVVVLEVAIVLPIQHSMGTSCGGWFVS